MTTRSIANQHAANDYGVALQRTSSGAKWPAIIRQHSDRGVPASLHHPPPQLEALVNRVEQYALNGQRCAVVVNMMCRMGKIRSRLISLVHRIHAAGAFLIILISPTGVTIDTRTKVGRQM